MLIGALGGMLSVPTGGHAPAGNFGANGSGGGPRPTTPVDGSSGDCDTIISFDFFGLFGFDIAEPGWVWIDPTDRYRDASGLVVKSRVTETDFPAGHDSHDQNTDIFLDPGQDDILSDVAKDHDGDGVGDSIEVEWEIGTFPGETGSDPERTFPKWAWPSLGDRVWTNGPWIFDCGHIPSARSLRCATRCGRCPGRGRRPSGSPPQTCTFTDSRAWSRTSWSADGT